MSTKLKGSLLRCLLMTGLPREEFAQILTNLSEPSGFIVTENDVWYPQGLSKPDEAILEKKNDLVLDNSQKDDILWWWLDHSDKASTPNWDIVSTATYNNKPALILVEAKAHYSEMSKSGKSLESDASQKSQDNHEKIGSAIDEANTELNKVISSNIAESFNISRDVSYQLSNRFAWSWKIASMGIPVVLIYLGFLNNIEMGDYFEDAHDWYNCVQNHSKGIIPRTVWGHPIDINGTPFWPLIKSIDIQVPDYTQSDIIRL